MALRNMFTRNKSEKGLQTLSPNTTTPSRSAVSGSQPKPAAKSSPQAGTPARTKASKLPSTVSTAAPNTPGKPTSKPSRANLRQSTTPAKSPPNSGPKPPHKQHTRLSAAWDPPPLFQAYPQAIKHAQLTASTLSADAILRMSNHKRNTSFREEATQSPTSPNQKASSDGKDKSSKGKKHKRGISGPISRADWTTKIYVLVTSGYLLQYAGEGSFDRLPEKMMQLGKDSVAFASDVIPGKHWVLQISQAMDANGIPAADSRSLLSRLNFRAADYRRTTTSFLLVLNNAEEMDSWIAAVRKEIEALGGKKHLTETGKPRIDEKVVQLKEQPSHRYLVKRDSALISSPASPHRFSFDSITWKKNGNSRDRLSGLFLETGEKQPPLQHSTSRQSLSNDTVSNDSDQIEKTLAEDQNRLSYMSSGQPTLITSQSASITSSPTRASFSTVDEFPPKISMDDVLARPNSAAISMRRKSAQALCDPCLLTGAAARTQPLSVFDASTKLMQCHSPSAPNFSVPVHSDRRFSSTTGTGVDTHSAPVAASARSVFETETALPEEAPNPPRVPISLKALEIPAQKGLLSKGPESGPTVITPTASSFVVVPHARPSLVHIPARSHSLQHRSPAPKIVTPARRASTFVVTPTSMDSQFSTPRSPSRGSPSVGSPSVRSLRLSGLGNRLSATPTTSPDNSPSNQATTKQSPSRKSQSKSRISVSAAPTDSSSTPTKSLRRTPPQRRISTTLQRLRADSNSKGTSSRGSLPTLVSGPPPAPPPNCALPPLPPAGSGGLRSPSGPLSTVKA